MIEALRASKVIRRMNAEFSAPSRLVSFSLGSDGYNTQKKVINF